MRVANRFTNPANGDVYDWLLNHDEEDESGKERLIERTAPTGRVGSTNVGLVKQQGDDTPLLLKWRGKILERSQLVQMIAWYQLCESQTIYVRDFAGDEYEVVITAFKPLRHRTSFNPRGGSTNRLHYWTYSIEFEVLRVISGTWAGVTP